MERHDPVDLELGLPARNGGGSAGDVTYAAQPIFERLVFRVAME